jgi:broad specificity phosphatase PhoE
LLSRPTGGAAGDVDGQPLTQLFTIDGGSWTLRTLLLIRHTAVCDSVRGRCYGQSDVPLRAAYRQDIDSAIEDADLRFPFARIYSSPLTRCRLLAEKIGSGLKLPVGYDDRLKERHFGNWELQSWDDIHAATGNAMDGLIDAPETFAPPGGETTRQFAQRVLAWHAELPDEGRFLVVTHGGPIAALRGSLAGVPVRDWPQLTPPLGHAVRLDG